MTKPRVVVIEDESMIAIMTEDILYELGFEVVATLTEFDAAIAAIRSMSMDIAVVDINLRGLMSYPIAAILQDRAIPFAFVTGYSRDHVPARFAAVPIILKPYRIHEMKTALDVARVVQARQIDMPIKSTHEPQSGHQMR